MLYAATFLVSGSILILEVILTRIFSVTLLYHFAFLVVSIAMFGTAFGAIIGYTLNYKRPGTLVLVTTIFAISIALCSLIIFKLKPIPFNELNTSIGITFLVNALVAIIPFTLGGIVISILITSNKKLVGKIYASDLLGAAVAGPLSIILINKFGVLSSLMFASMLSLIAAYLLFAKYNSITTKSMLSLTLVGLLTAGLLNVLVPNPSSLRLRSTKPSAFDQNPIFEKWNIYSRVTATHAKDCCLHGNENPSDVLGIVIDSSAYTPIINYNGNPADYSYLKEELSNQAHYLRPNSDVLVIGTGGGKDILSSLIFDQKSTTGLEINTTIHNLLKDHFAHYSGNLYRNQKVTLINSEARSWIAQQDKRFDIIQISLIDTWAASSSGAYSLTENGLYTTEAACTFFDKLSDDGVISITRWYSKEFPGELYKLTALYAHGLKTCLGVTNPQSHMIIIGDINVGPTSRANMIASKTPFKEGELQRFSASVVGNGYTILYSNDHSIDKNLSLLFDPNDYKPLEDQFGVDLTPPTDDSPYFFNMVSPKNAFKLTSIVQGANTVNSLGTTTLVLATFTSIILSASLLFAPKHLGGKFKAHKIPKTKALYFISIGLGFMLIEISLLQRFSIFLGHPSFGLIAILSPLLLAAGLGSAFAQNLINKNKSGGKAILLIILILSLSSYTIPVSIKAFYVYGLYTRAAIASLLVLPVGFSLGIAMPLGLSEFMDQNEFLSLWVWSVNGAFSVLGSTLAILLSLTYSITTAFTVGIICYAIAYVSYKLSLE